jgi:3-oxoacyl-[acyl-carrier-protein] synthase I
VSVPPVAILGCGMMTGVGLTAEASCAAIRARLDNFRETRFMASAGEWIIGSEVPLEEPWRGIPRLARLLAGPLRECLDVIPDVPPKTIPVLLCVAEEERPGRLDGLGNPLFFDACELLGVRFHDKSRVIAQGRVGGAVALHHASRTIHQQGFRHVIAAGVDSYLVAGTLAAYNERDRLLTAENSNGFIPGEGGAALLVGPPDAHSEMVCLGFGFAMENATIESEEPLRADGMVAALQQALAAAGLTMAQIGYRIADISGEQYAFKEADLAVSRILRDRHDFQDLWHPADCIGETGAAAVPGMLAVALTAARNGYAAGDPVLAHSGNDDGRRAAIVLSAQGQGRA